MSPTQVFTQSFTDDPWPVLARLRADGGVHRILTPDGPPAWLVTRHNDVFDLLLDDRLSTRPEHARAGEYVGFVLPPELRRHMLNVDSTEHAVLRRAVTSTLSPKNLVDADDRLREVVSRHLAGVRSDEPFDFVREVAVPLPAYVVGEVLGLPEGVRDALEQWAFAVVAPRHDGQTRARDTLGLMQDVIGGSLADTSTSPLAQIIGHVRADGLGREHVTALVFYLLFVWYEVLTGAIGAGLLALADHGTRDVVGVDELLRYTSPQMLAGPRFALRDIVVNDVTISQGECVLLSLASANHDETVFTDPARLDFTRTANLAFGHGPHACVGTSIVRSLLAVLFPAVFETWPHLRLAEEPVRWGSGFRHRGPVRLVVER
jgi:cytochrome P450